MLSGARVLISISLLAGLAAYVVLWPPQRASATRLDEMPASILGFPGSEVGLDQAVLDDLNPDGLICREYRRPDNLPVWLIVVYFENARLGAHDPLLCYRSQGFTIEPLPDETLSSSIGPIPMRSFRAVRGGRVERVSYFWYTAGAQALAEVKAFRDSMFWQGLLHNRSFGAFVRVSTIETDPEQANAIVARFVQQMAPSLPKIFPEHSQ
jgi:EpsI family protein